MREIPVAGSTRPALVDDADYERIASVTWHITTGGYVAHTENFRDADGRRVSRRLRMHRVVLDAPDGVPVDHVDGDRLNNTRQNLRPCTASTNAANVRVVRAASGFKGVSLHRQTGKWQAQICVRGKHHYLGLFGNKEEAAAAYLSAAREAFGDFAYSNFGGLS